MSQSTHLHDTIRDIAQQSAEDRIAHLRKDRWVDYPIANERWGGLKYCSKPHGEPECRAC